MVVPGTASPTGEEAHDPASGKKSVRISARKRTKNSAHDKHVKGASQIEDRTRTCQSLTWFARGVMNTPFKKGLWKSRESKVVVDNV